MLPYFANVTRDLEEAREDILETLESYGARTRAELLNVVQIIAFGLSTLDVLTEAKDLDLSPSMRLRFRGCANSLNRTSQQNEKTLARRLASDPPNAPGSGEPANAIGPVHAGKPADALDAAKPRPEPAPVNDPPQTRFHETAQTEATRNRLSAAAPVQPPTSPEQRNRLAWAGAMIDTLAQMGIPVEPLREN